MILVMEYNFEYQPYFCEENIWHLCQQETFTEDVDVIFISNVAHQVAVWAQVASKDDEPVVWDYHVVLARINDAEVEIWDLDTTLGCPCDADTYLRASFRLSDPHSPYAPMFRVIERSAFLATFRSDRSHMVDSGVDFPPWKPISTESNLSTFCDMNDDEFGEVFDLAGVRGRLLRVHSS